MKAFIILIILLVINLSTTSAKIDGFEWTVYNTSNSGLPGIEVRVIAIDGSGNKWIGNSGNGLVKYDDTNWIVYDTTNSGLPGNDFMIFK